MAKGRVPEGTKKKTWECYNYRIKGYLIRDYRKLKTGIGLQKK